MDWFSASDLWALMVSKKSKFIHAMQQPKYIHFKGVSIQLRRKKNLERSTNQKKVENTVFE